MSLGSAPPLRGAAAAAACALACAALAGCGGDDEQKPAGVDLTTVRCPLVSEGADNGTEGVEPAKDAFDTATLLGKPIDDAQSTAGEHGCTVVVSVEDDRGLPV